MRKETKLKKEEAQRLGEDTGSAQSEPEYRKSIGVITTVKFKVRGGVLTF